jgi:hypothetical protein
LFLKSRGSVLVGCGRLQHISAMVASLDAMLLFVLTAFGVVSAVAGLVLLFRGGAHREEQVVEVLGLKFRFTSAGLVVFLIGALFLAVPVFVSVDRSPVHDGPPALVPEGGGGSTDRVQGGEAEPNDYVTEANAVEFGATYAGAIDRNDKDFFAFEVGPGPQALRLILRRVQGTGGLVVGVFDPQGKESRVGYLQDVLSEKVEVDEAGTYVLRLNAYGDLRYELVLQPG